MSTARRPLLAAIMNVIIPGLGQLYAGAPLDAIRWALMPIFGLGLMALVAFTFPPSTAMAVLLFLIGPGILLVIGWSGWRSANKAATPYLLGPSNRWYWYLVFAVVTNATHYFLVRPYYRGHFLQAFTIPSVSMEPTLLVGDYLFVDRRPITPGSVRRGEIVVYRSIEIAGIEAIKRVVGLAGDTLQMIDGVLLLNGVRQEGDPFQRRGADAPPAPETAAAMRKWMPKAFVGALPADYAPDFSNWGPILVPEGAVFIMGDNRVQSWDGRAFGPIPIANVSGRPLVIYFNRSILLPGMAGRIGKVPK